MATVKAPSPPVVESRDVTEVRGPSQWQRLWHVTWPPVLLVGLLIIVWQIISLWLISGLEEGTFQYRQQQSILPSPLKVFAALFSNLDVFLDAGRVTLVNAFIGFVLGAIIGYGIALLMSTARWFERSFYVYIVASQMVPVIALAPVLYGIIKDETILKVTIAAYLTFFPVTVNVLRGLRSANPSSLELMYTYAASQRQIYTKLRVPASLPFLFNALKIASTGSLIGAIVAELMGGNAGLGVLILKLQYNAYAVSDKLWALIIEVALIGMLFFLAVSVLERIVVPWQPEYRKK